MISICEYVNTKSVVFLNSDSRDAAIFELVENLNNQGLLHDKASFVQAILDREKVVSTGIGMGVAIPHAKLPSYDDFFISIGILKEGVSWEAMDQVPVRIVFLVGGPDDKQTKYLQILSSLTIAVKDKERRKRILSCSDAEQVVSLFSDS